MTCLVRSMLLLALGACGDDATGDDAGPGDGGLDAAPSDGGPGDGGSDGGGSDAARDGAVDEHGFPLRTPMRVSVTCDPDPFSCPDGMREADQIDHVCTLGVDGHDALVYVQADPTGVNPLGIGGIPLYEEVRAWVYDRTAMMTVMLTEAGYDIGGGHHNDFIDITYEGQHYRYNHSSYGFGFRACAPPDCVQKLDSGGTVTDDGCIQMPEMHRSHPEVCVVLMEPVVPTLEDMFMRCMGDPYGP